jgi:glycosyltransferase involved in cell wall biosynthesis
MKKINTLLIGVLPPPINGQTIAFQALVDKLGGEILTLNGKRHQNFWGIFPKILTFLGVLFQLNLKIIFKKYHIYHTLSQSQDGFIRDLPIILFSKVFGSKIIVHIHGGNFDGFYHSQNPIIRKLICFMLRKTDKIIVLSEKLTKMFDFEPKLKAKIRIVPNGLPWELNHEAVPPKALPLNKNKPIRLIFLSNLIESKGYLDVLEATEILTNRLNYNIKVDFCGEFIQYDDAKRFHKVEDARSFFFSFIEKNNLSQNVHYKGVLKGNDKIRLLAEAHFFILPTQYKNEGQPISIIEAMANRCVVLTTNYRGISEMIKPNKSGIFVEFNNPENIAQQIHLLVQNPKKYNQISENGYQNFLENYTNEKHLQNLSNEIILCAE